ncbi:hypothetical protein Glove_326g24 [Diversispora epigaea]|uniref:Uncharacterized protein n=1 Tax=Diversispora epigaea TaxID=1348612 RepID=A0A397HQ73_9GLOM|nr:hypothetical protein Glove_326g24 [Diversispora epigaea]
MVARITIAVRNQMIGVTESNLSPILVLVYSTLPQRKVENIGRYLDDSSNEDYFPFPYAKEMVHLNFPLWTFTSH